MKCFIIAQVVDGYNKLIGYKLFDSDTGETMVVDSNQIKTVLEKQPDFIKNASLINGIISGSNGKLDRYARVDRTGNLVAGDKSPLVVLNRIETVGYTVVDFKGQTARMANDKVVEYAKSNGIANGKVVTQDSIEYISSISGEYETVKLTPSKVGANTKVNIPIRIGGDAASVARHTAEDIETEMEYNDVFSAMNGEQRSVLKQYYTWYTVDAYQKMAKNVRLDLAPGKAEKLAQLRGTDKWEFAGINDSHMEGNFKAHCELGHRLRYEYFAIPEGVLDENHNIRTRSSVGYMRARRDTVQELREAGAIVFGETCAGDFFNISPDDMKTLVKIRTTMSDEIELMSNILTNHLEDSFKSKCKLLYQIIAKLGSTENVVKTFGDNIGYTLLAFIKAKMPFTKSLVILAAGQARKDKEQFYKNVFPEYSDVITELYKTADDYKNVSNATGAGKYLLDFVAEYTIEGAYQYDPVGDTENTRRDIGRYNKETRCLRDAQCSGLIINTSVNVRLLDNIETLINYFKAYKFYRDVMIESVKLYENTILKYKYSRYSRLTKQLENLTIATKNTDETDEELGLTYDRKSMVKVITSSAFIKDSENIFYPYTTYGTFSSYCRNKTFRGLKEYNYTDRVMYRVEPWKNIGDIAADIDELVSHGIKPADVAEMALRPLITKHDKLDEAERKKPKYIKFDLKLETRDSKYKYDNIAVAKLDYIQNEELLKAMENSNSTYGVNTNEIDNKSTLLNVGEFYATREITEMDYEYYINNIIKNRKFAKERMEIEEKAKKEEEARLAALAEKQRIEREEAAKKEMEDEAKMDKLQKLLNEYKGDRREYGIQTAQAILNQGIVYSKLSTKQRWRIDKTLKDLENQSGKVDYDLDNFVITEQKPVENNKEESNTENKQDKQNTQDKQTKANNFINEENLKGLDDKEAADAVRLLLTHVNIKTEQDSNISFSAKVALTINNTGKVSEKQKNYLMKGYEKLKERIG